MGRTLATLLLVACVLVAGCAGTGGGDGTPTGTETTDGTPTNADTTDGPGTAESVENLSFTDGTELNTTALYRAQFEYFNDSDGYVAQSSIRFDEPTANGLVERYDERRLDLVNNRGYGVTEFVATDDTRRQSQAYFFNESVLVRLDGPPGQATPQSRSFPSNFYARAVSSYGDATAIELTAPLDYRFENATTIDGETVYRFTADSFASDADRTQIEQFYGENATVGSATLLVTGEGHIVSFEATYTSGPPDNRRGISATYDVTVGETTVETPEWVADSG